MRTGPHILLACILSCTAIAQDEPAKENEEVNDPRILQRRGTDHFFAGRIKESLEDWDRVVELVPQQYPHHWQQ